MLSVTTRRHAELVRVFGGRDLSETIRLVRTALEQVNDHAQVLALTDRPETEELSRALRLRPPHVGDLRTSVVLQPAVEGPCRARVARRCRARGGGREACRDPIGDDERHLRRQADARGDAGRRGHAADVRDGRGPIRERPRGLGEAVGRRQQRHTYDLAFLASVVVPPGVPFTEKPFADITRT